MSTPIARLIVAVLIVAVALLIGRWLQHRRRSDAPTQRRAILPEQVDRHDFQQPETPWLLAVFTSDTCSTCADVADKARVVACDEVGVQIVSYQSDGDLQRRYGIDSVPSLIVADAAGVVQANAVGPITATDLWAMIADVRYPGSIERGACGHHGEPTGDEPTGDAPTGDDRHDNRDQV